jgi:hypothetical protein
MKFKIGDKVKNRWGMIYQITSYWDDDPVRFNGELLSPSTQGVQQGQMMHGMDEQHFQLTQRRRQQTHPLTDFFKK